MRKWVAKHPLLSFCLAATAWVCALYSGMLKAPFVYDDIGQIANNPALQSWSSVYSHFILAPVTLTTGFLGSGGSIYRPLFWISLSIDRHLWGTDASGFHFTSLFLHWLNGVLLFQLFRKIKLSPFVSALTALAWLGLPVNSEAVAWISARAYLLSTASMLLALFAALAYVRQKSWQSLAAFIAFALMADFSHEQGVLLVAFVALISLVETERASDRWIVLGAASLLSDVLYAVVKSGVGAHSGTGERTLWSIGLKFWEYVELILLPVRMSPERSSAVPANVPSALAFLAWTALIGFITAAFVLRKHAPSVAAGLAVLFIGLLPYCGFAYIYQGIAERFTYLPAIGLMLALVTAGMATRQLQAQVLLGCLIAWATWGAWRLTLRVRDWQDPVALFQNSLIATPHSAYLQKDLGDVYADRGDFLQAITQYRRSLSIAPNNAEAVLNYAAALQQKGDKSEAEVQYRRAMELRPRNSAAYVDLESLYIEQGRLDDAIAMYKQAVTINPDDANAYFDLGVMFQQRGQDRDALAFYKKVLQLRPNDPQTLLYLSKLKIAASAQ